jgi:dehydration protein DpgD
LLTGRHITAEEAYRIGIANEVVPLADLMTTAEKWAADILGCAPLSVRSTKEASMKGLDMPLKEALHTTFPVTKEMRASKDIVDSPLAFSEKRPPNWQGR